MLLPFRHAPTRRPRHAGGFEPALERRQIDLDQLVEPVANRRGGLTLKVRGSSGSVTLVVVTLDRRSTENEAGGDAEGIVERLRDRQPPRRV